MLNLISLSLLLLTIVLSAGGGLYEILVIYPNWKHSVDAADLKERLQSSGQNYASRRFWPLVSPAQGLLSMLNMMLAFRYEGPAHDWWLTAAILIFVTRIITFAYFIPAILRLMQPDKIPPAELPARIKRWTTLSPLRLITEFAALITAMCALHML